MNHLRPRPKKQILLSKKSAQFFITNTILSFKCGQYLDVMVICLYILGKKTLQIMGKGDRKTKKGKIVKGTFGVRRPKKRSSAPKPKEVAKPAKKAPAKAKKKPAKKEEKKES